MSARSTTPRFPESNNTLLLLITLAITIVFIGTCKGQDSVKTPTIVLNYLYQQDINCKYLIKDTTAKATVISELEGQLLIKDTLIANKQKEIIINNNLSAIELNAVKKSKRKYVLATYAGLIVNVIKTSVIINYIFNAK